MWGRSRDEDRFVCKMVWTDTNLTDSNLVDISQLSPIDFTKAGRAEKGKKKKAGEGEGARAEQLKVKK